MHGKDGLYIETGPASFIDILQGYFIGGNRTINPEEYGYAHRLNVQNSLNNHNKTKHNKACSF